MSEKKYKSFWSFYPYYLTEHSDPVCRELHFVGTMGFFIILSYALISQNWIWLLALPLCGYGFAWTGHFFFEKNKPATFQYPLYSLGSDFVMFYHILTNQIEKRLKQAQATVK